MTGTVANWNYISRLGKWLKRYALNAQNRFGSRQQLKVASDAGAGGKLGDITDLTDPNFGVAFLGRFPNEVSLPCPRKRWELAWLAQRFEDLNLGDGSMLGLGVGHEPLIYHFANRAKEVVATDLYSLGTAWGEARLSFDAVYNASPFPYPRERLTVQNMDMRKLAFPSDRFDVVWSCSSVEHVQTIPQFVQIFREIHRVLKPGGVALITTEFSLGEPFFLPGVLSLWKDSDLFTKPLKGLTLLGSADLTYHSEVEGNLPSSRRDAHRHKIYLDREIYPVGLCINVGYTTTIPVAMAFRKTGDHFEWPEFLGAPKWYESLATGIELFEDKSQAAAAAEHFRAALALADTPGARLHCFRSLIETHVHSGQGSELNDTLTECQRVLRELPDDDDALDLIGYVAAGAGRLHFARRCWERAFSCPSALPSSRFRIRINQLEAELNANGYSVEAHHLNGLAEAAWHESLDFMGAANPLSIQLSERLHAVRQRYHLSVPVSSAPAVAAEPESSPPEAVPSNPDPVTADRLQFNAQIAAVRPLIYIGDNIALTRTVYGHKMYVDARTQVAACYLLDGYWEEWIMRHLPNYVKPGMNVLDIGANMGFYTVVLADLVGPTGRVTAFEAQPKHFEILRRNVVVNGFQDRTTLVPKVVHAAEGTYNFGSYEQYGTGGVMPDQWNLPDFALAGETPKKMSLQGTSVDKYFEGQNPQIDFIKIDVDGAEPHIFKGMQSILRGNRPLTIFCEYWPARYRQDGLDPVEFLECIRAANFKVSEFTPDGIRPIESLSSIPEDKWTELLLVRE